MKQLFCWLLYHIPQCPTFRSWERGSQVWRQSMAHSESQSEKEEGRGGRGTIYLYLAPLLCGWTHWWQLTNLERWKNRASGPHASITVNLQAHMALTMPPETQQTEYTRCVQFSASAILAKHFDPSKSWDGAWNLEDREQTESMSVR